jgi:ATP-binding cassette, subfamily G (WHITE), member 2, PDR
LTPFPSNTTCGEYLADYLKTAPARLMNPSDTKTCRVCPVTGAHDVLARMEFRVQHVWRDCGISIVYTVINIGLALLLYWLARVPKEKGNTRSGEKQSTEEKDRIPSISG